MFHVKRERMARTMKKWLIRLSLTLLAVLAFLELAHMGDRRID